ncbi:amidase [Muricoccus radiodurans]|uniref:amidase n=1 Tax=Muricoccus radiodurans TaxID=2231721 RepID=UPI003CF17BDE
MADLVQLPAAELRRRIARRDLSPVELLRDVRARIDRLNPSLNAFVEMCWDRAEREAVAAEARAMQGGDLPPLLGLPVAVKESTNVEGLHTTLGSPLFADRVAAEDAPTVAAIRAAGGIVIGKTNVPELLQGGTSRNTIYGLTRNAHDPSLSCLGSSGGSAVALSADMVPLATGSDMGGSIRGPSAGNGTAGLRPSPGLVAYPSLPIAFDVSSVVGPMARSTEDVMLLLAGMICSSPLDPFDWTPDLAPLLDPVPADPRTLRVAVSPDLGCVKVDAGIRARFEEVIAAIAPHVGRVEWVTPDFGPITHAFYMLRTLAYLVAYGEVHETAPDRLTPQKNVDLRRGFAASTRQIAEAQRVQTVAFRALATLLQGHDVLITPGANEPLPSVAEVERREAALRADNARYGADEYDFDRMPSASINTPITWTAHPVATITAGRGRDGMPFGINLIGRYRDDVRLLRIALAVEQVLHAQEGFGRPMPDLSRLAAVPA